MVWEWGVRSRIVRNICRVAGVRRWVFLQSRQTRDQHDNCYDILEVIAQRDHMLGSTKSSARQINVRSGSNATWDQRRRAEGEPEQRGHQFGRVGVGSLDFRWRNRCFSTREPTRRAFSRLRETAHMICQPHRRASPLPNSENLDLLTRSLACYAFVVLTACWQSRAISRPFPIRSLNKFVDRSNRSPCIRQRNVRFQPIQLSRSAIHPLAVVAFRRCQYSAVASRSKSATFLFPSSLATNLMSESHFCSGPAYILVNCP